MSKRFPLICLFGLVLGACTSMRGAEPTTMSSGSPIDDTFSVRAIKPSVSVYVVAGNGSEDVSVDEEPVHRKPGDDRDIVFKLRTQGYKFPMTNAVSFNDPKFAPGKDVVCKTRNDQEVICSNKGDGPTVMSRKKGRYKYTIQVLRADGTSLDPLDPFIVNH